MKRRLYILLNVVGLLASAFLTAEAVHATLGESVNSIESDKDALSAASSGKSTHDSLTILEIQSDSTTVREYISPSGVVFAVAWNGLIRPDLTQLLGSYSNEYHNALRQIPRDRGRSRLDVKTGRLVVQQWGHMRNLKGRAYVPSLIPLGVSVDEIR